MATLKTDNILGTAIAAAVTVGDGSTATDLTVKGNIVQVAGNNTFVSDSISGAAIECTTGAITDFRSTGIDDRTSTTNCLTLNSSDNVVISAGSDLQALGDASVAGDLTVANVEVTGTLTVGTSTNLFVFGYMVGTVDVSILLSHNASDPNILYAKGGLTSASLTIDTTTTPDALVITYNSGTKPTSANYQVIAEMDLGSGYPSEMIVLAQTQDYVSFIFGGGGSAIADGKFRVTVID